MKPDPNGLNAHVPLPEYIQNMKKIVLHLKVTILKPPKKKTTINFVAKHQNSSLINYQTCWQSLSEKTRIIVLSTPAVNEEQIIKKFG